MSNLRQFLSQADTETQLLSVIDDLMQGCQDIAEQLSAGELAGILGATDSTNVQGETQKPLDIISNQILKDKLLLNSAVAGIASEEEDLPVGANNDGRYLVVFDPLDGSSNIDVNVSVGTIFSILKCPEGLTGAEPQAYLQKGRAQIAAGYVLYGPSTLLVMSTGKGTHLFTLSPEGEFILSKKELSIPSSTEEFAINVSNQRFWEAEMQSYIADLLAGKKGPRAKDFNMRWVASMVAEVHRVLIRGGIFTYPWDARKVSQPGKLRLLYEGNPMSLLVEQANGIAHSCYANILDIQPTDIHQRVSVALGSSQEVDTLISYHKNTTSTAAKLNS